MTKRLIDNEDFGTSPARSDPLAKVMGGRAGGDSSRNSSVGKSRDKRKAARSAADGENVPGLSRVSPTRTEKGEGGVPGFPHRFLQDTRARAPAPTSESQKDLLSSIDVLQLLITSYGHTDEVDQYLVSRVASVLVPAAKPLTHLPLYLVNGSVISTEWSAETQSGFLEDFHTAGLSVLVRDPEHPARTHTHNLVCGDRSYLADVTALGLARSAFQVSTKGDSAFDYQVCGWVEFRDSGDAGEFQPNAETITAYMLKLSKYRHKRATEVPYAVRAWGGLEPVGELAATIVRALADRRCRGCREPLPVEAPLNRLYCPLTTDRCRKRWQRLCKRLSPAERIDHAY